MLVTRYPLLAASFHRLQGGLQDALRRFDDGDQNPEHNPGGSGPRPPGGLAAVLDQLAEAGVSIDYLYSISFWNICFAVRDIDRAVQLLDGKVTLLGDEEVRAL